VAAPEVVAVRIISAPVPGDALTGREVAELMAVISALAMVFGVLEEL
jgi:hypothetical protein